MTPLSICLFQWDANNKRIQKIIDTISDDNYIKPIIAGGNSPSWILGHLIEGDDSLLELLGIGKRKFPELKEIYHHERGNNQSGHLSKTELSAKWKEILSSLNASFEVWSEADWLSRHMAVSEEDFKAQPHRNKLNVMLSRVTHKASHLGQMAMQK